jgi:5-enolpyruvylshikimate-3-phosphate synthase
MEIKAEKFTIEMNHEDFWDLAFNVRTSLIFTLKTHWINHQDAWRRIESNRLEVCKKMFNALGRVDLYESIFNEADEIFKEFNEKNPSE